MMHRNSVIALRPVCALLIVSIMCFSFFVATAFALAAQQPRAATPAVQQTGQPLQSTAIEKIEYVAGDVEGWLDRDKPWVFTGRPKFTITEQPRADRAQSIEERQTFVTADRVQISFTGANNANPSANEVEVLAEGNVVVERLRDKATNDKLVIEAGRATIDPRRSQLVFEQNPHITSLQYTTAPYDQIIVNLDTGHVLFKVKPGGTVSGEIRIPSKKQ